MLGKGSLALGSLPDLFDDDRLNRDRRDSQLQWVSVMSIFGENGSAYVELVDVGSANPGHAELVDIDRNGLARGVVAGALGERVLRVLVLSSCQHKSHSTLAVRLTW